MPREDNSVISTRQNDLMAGVELLSLLLLVEAMASRTDVRTALSCFGVLIVCYRMMLCCHCSLSSALYLLNYVRSPLSPISDLDLMVENQIYSLGQPAFHNHTNHKTSTYHEMMMNINSAASRHS